MSLDSVVNIQISTTGGGLSLPGFGRALFATVHNHYSDLTRVYTDPTQLLTDGWLSTDQLYLDAVAHMSQRPHPIDFKVGKRQSAVAQVVTVTVVGHADGTYSITVNGQTYSTVASSQSATQIRDTLLGLMTATGASALSGVTATSASTNQITVTANTPGVPFTLGLTAPSSGLTQVTSTPSTGITEDLSAIVAADNDWAHLLLDTRDDGVNLAAAVAIEALPGQKTFGLQSATAAIVSAAYSSGNIYADLFSHLKGLGLARTLHAYHPDPTASLAAGWAGAGLPYTPASITWKFKQLIGVTPVTLTPTQINNLLSKNGNSYRTEAGVGMTFEGSTPDGEFFDVIRGTDKLRQDMQVNIFTSLRKAKKTPYSPDGLPIVEAAMRAALEQAVADGLIAQTRTLPDGTEQRPAYTVTMPKISDIPLNVRAGRTIPLANAPSFEGTLAGAIHALAVTGSLSA